MFQSDRSHLPILFLNSYRDLVPEDSDVFLYEDLFSQLDLEDWDYAYGIEGQAKPPELMLRTLFYGLTHGIVSGRKLEEVCRNDIRYMFLCGGLRPDRRTFDRFLQRHEGRFNELFVTIVKLAAKMSLVKLGRVAFDGTRIKGYTSKSGLKFESMNKAVVKIEEQLRELKEAIKKENELEQGSTASDRLHSELKSKQVRLERIKRAKAELEAEHLAKHDKSPPGHAQKSLHDPDALSLSHKTKEFMFGYNAQAAVDAESQIIVAADLHMNATEYQAFPKLCDEVEKNLSQVPGEILADTGYYSHENIAYALASGSTPYIAPVSEKDLPQVVKVSSESVLFEQVVENAAGRFECMSGKVLPENSRRNGNVEFRPRTLTFCRSCTQQEGCQVRLKTYFNMPLSSTARRAVLEHKNRENSADFYAVYKYRKAIVEPVFGNIKSNKGMRLYHVGKKNVRRQFRLWCSAHNIEKIIKHRAKNQSHGMSRPSNSLFYNFISRNMTNVGVRRVKSVKISKYLNFKFRTCQSCAPSSKQNQ